MFKIKNRPITSSLELIFFLFFLVLLLVLAGSPSRGGDLTVYVLDISQPSLPTPFILFSYLFLPLWPFQLDFIP